MGDWGDGIFSNDFAADLRGDWREAIIDGLAPEEATALLAERHGGKGSPFWVALAAAQHQTGHLLADVRDRALAAIDAGEDFEGWEADARRSAVLRRLAERLRGPQPAPKRLRGPRVVESGVEVGDVIRVREPLSGREGLVAVVGEREGWPRGVREPIVEYLLWDGGEIPSRRSLARRRALIDTGWERWVEPLPWRAGIMLVPQEGSFGRHVGEIVARGIRRPPVEERPKWCVRWSELAHRLLWTEYFVSVHLTRRSARQVRSERIRLMVMEIERDLDALAEFERGPALDNGGRQWMLEFGAKQMIGSLSELDAQRAARLAERLEVLRRA
jgi:hypothetical protein